MSEEKLDENFVEKQLQIWGMSEYIEKFKGQLSLFLLSENIRIIIRKHNNYIICLDQQIDEQAFLYMPESMIKELIPVIGKRFHLLQKRNHFLSNLEKENLDLVRYFLYFIIPLYINNKFFSLDKNFILF